MEWGVGVIHLILCVQICPFCEPPHGGVGVIHLILCEFEPPHNGMGGWGNTSNIVCPKFCYLNGGLG